ncbi:amidohydrolase [Leucogyrophana mollusca]|uniref:Amidohydrolase n=1 Tax=Leucogyrophana mollusca TaxID=85980 RepID=A0ACB8BPP2_9AGAM|nr:amidohydrolase [Leucogyrophana mollusca]
MPVEALDVHAGKSCLSLSSLFRSRPTRSSRNTSDPNIGLDGRYASKQSNLSATEESADLEPCIYYGSCCDFAQDESASTSSEWDALPAYSPNPPSNSLSPEILQTIEDTVDGLDPALRSLSLQIHDHPELMFEEKFAHDILSDFMETHGFTVTRHYLGLDTAWRAEYTHGKGGRTLGINSEMDALPLIGHACGHNLIAISGVGVAIAVKTALRAHNVSGKVVLLGTPGEEGGGGKIILLQRGGYKGMDACLMCHPSPGIPNSVALASTSAMQSMDVEFFGHSAHAGAAPWEGTNALDAAFLAYSSVSVLRQQIKPDHRVHGVIQGNNGSANVIPDYAKMRWFVRAPTRDQLVALRQRVQACFEGAALSTSCRVSIVSGNDMYFDLHQNSVLAEDFASTVSTRFGMRAGSRQKNGASTDFGNVSYELPSIHPSFAIPTQLKGGNHSPPFAESARTTEAHKACMVITKGLASTGFRVIDDDRFFKKVKEAFRVASME